MATFSNSVIVQNPEIHSGEPVFRGTRVPFQTLLDYLEGGETLDEFLEQFPGVSRENAIAVLEEARAPTEDLPVSSLETSRKTIPEKL
jgi:uncharacterized protein (DUF433 family)